MSDTQNSLSSETLRLVSWWRDSAEWGPEGEALVLKDGEFVEDESGHLRKATLERAEEILGGVRVRIIRELAQLHRELELCVTFENHLRYLS